MYVCMYVCIYIYICTFLYIIMYTVNIVKAMKKMFLNDIRDFIFENYYKNFDFLKKAIIIQQKA